MKTRQPLWRISVATSPDAEATVAEFLGDLFQASPAIYSDAETGVSTVSVFLNHKPDARQVRSEIRIRLKLLPACGLDPRAARIGIVKVRREDWAESWKRHFHPLAIGKSLLVKPSWSKKRPLKTQAVVILDPGLSFGTGQHPTTAFCLNEIVRRRRNGTTQSFLDIGSGSGILSIAAAKIGYQTVHGCDFDPEAVRVARENARKNRVDGKLKLTRSDVTRWPLKSTRQYDLICANLISNLLVAEKMRIVSRMKPDGTLVLAGILASEFGTVEKEFARQGLKQVASRVEKEWQSGAFRFAKKFEQTPARGV